MPGMALVGNGNVQLRLLEGNAYVFGQAGKLRWQVCDEAHGSLDVVLYLHEEALQAELGCLDDQRDVQALEALQVGPVVHHEDC